MIAEKLRLFFSLRTAPLDPVTNRFDQPVPGLWQRLQKTPPGAHSGASQQPDGCSAVCLHQSQPCGHRQEANCAVSLLQRCHPQWRSPDTDLLHHPHTWEEDSVAVGKESQDLLRRRVSVCWEVWTAASV